MVDLPTWVGDQVLTLNAVQRLVEANASAATVLHARPSMRRLLEVLFPAVQVVTSRRRASPVTMAYRLCRHGGRFAVGITFRPLHDLIGVSLRFTLHLVCLGTGLG